MKKYGNTFSTASSEYAGKKVPIWLHVDEFYPAGCTLNNQTEGAVIPIGTPVAVSKMGAEATILETFTVVGAVNSAATSVVLKSTTGVLQPAKDLIVGKAGANGVIAKALKLPAVTSVGSDEHAGEYTFTITANSLGTLADGDLLVLAAEAGSDKAAVMPTGLLYEDVLIGNAGATGTIVTKGQVLADRIAAVPDTYKPALSNITFVKE